MKLYKREKTLDFSIFEFLYNFLYKNPFPRGKGENA